MNQSKRDIIKECKQEIEISSANLSIPSYRGLFFGQKCSFTLKTSEKASYMRPMYDGLCRMSDGLRRMSDGLRRKSDGLLRMSETLLRMSDSLLRMSETLLPKSEILSPMSETLRRMSSDLGSMYDCQYSMLVQKNLILTTIS